MSYFKARPAQPIKRPMVYKVILVQVLITLLSATVTTWFAPIIGLSVLLGGVISIVGQIFFNVRALRYFGSPQTQLVVSSTYLAMFGKWLIMIAGSVIALVEFEELNAGMLLASLFTVHTVGAFLLPVLVKRAAH